MSALENTTIKYIENNWGQWRQNYNYEVEVPVDYWARGAVLTPEHTRGRVDQMLDFERLFDGDYSRYFLEQFTVPINYHELIATFLSDQLMSIPPIYPESEYVSPRFDQMLNEALRNVLIDIARFGAGVFHLTMDTVIEQAQVHAVKPIYYFPAPDGASVYLEPSPIPDMPLQVWTSYPDGSWGWEQYDNSANAQLGTLLDADGGAYGDVAAWDAIYEASIGRVGTLINCAISPKTGDWGRSFYKLATGVIFELNRIVSQSADILSYHGNPRDLVVPMDNVLAPQMTMDPGRDLQQAIHNLRTLSQGYEQWRNDRIIQLPAGAQNLRQLYFEGSFDSPLALFQKLQQILFAMTYIPAAWYLEDKDSRQSESGRALRYRFIPTAAHFQNVITTLIGKTQTVRASAATMNGAPASEIERLQGEETVWWTIFADLDTDTEVVMADEAEVQDAPAEEADNVVSTE